MISGDSYPRVTANLESYIPFSRRTTGLLNVQGGANFGYEKNVMNEFIVGGLTKTFRNQITFAGIQEGTIYSPSLLALQGGARVMMFSNTYITARANVLFNNLFSKSEYFDYPDFFQAMRSRLLIILHWGRWRYQRCIVIRRRGCRVILI